MRDRLTAKMPTKLTPQHIEFRFEVFAKQIRKDFRRVWIATKTKLGDPVTEAATLSELYDRLRELEQRGLL